MDCGGCDCGGCDCGDCNCDCDCDCDCSCLKGCLNVCESCSNTSCTVWDCSCSRRRDKGKHAGAEYNAYRRQPPTPRHSVPPPPIAVPVVYVPAKVQPESPKSPKSPLGTEPRPASFDNLS